MASPGRKTAQRAIVNSESKLPDVRPRKYRLGFANSGHQI
jgi:hypothetical protein